MIRCVNVIQFNIVSFLQADTELIIGQVAVASERKTLFEDANKIYDLAGVSYLLH
jgi:hypothetical protein